MEKMEFFGACMPVCGITPATFADTLIDYYHAIHANLPSVAGQLGATYAVPILYVPLRGSASRSFSPSPTSSDRLATTKRSSTRASWVWVTATRLPTFNLQISGWFWTLGAGRLPISRR